MIDLNYPTITRVLAAEGSVLDSMGQQLKEVFLKHFPKCYFDFSGGQLSPTNDFKMLSFRLVGDKNKLPHGISENDPAKSLWSFELLPDGRVKAELSHGGRYSIVSADPRFAMESVKLGWRNKTATPEQLVAYFDKYLARAKQIMQQNVNNSYGDAKQVAIYKEYLK